MSQPRKQYPPLPGECFAWFTWSLQRADGDLYVAHVSVLDRQSRQVVTSARWTLESTTLDRQAVTATVSRAKGFLARYMNEMFDHQLELF